MGRETQIRVLECDRPEISYYYTFIYQFEGKVQYSIAVKLSITVLLGTVQCCTVQYSMLFTPPFLA